MPDIDAPTTEVDDTNEYPDDYFESPAPELADWLHRAPSPDDPTAEEMQREEESNARWISEGEVQNVPVLKPKPGKQYLMRFLRFGTRQRVYSLIGWHRVFRRGKILCPKFTDHELGGYQDPPCPLCVMMRDKELPDFLKPRHKFDFWVYLILLSRNDHPGWTQHDPEKEAVVRRLNLKHPARVELHVAARTNLLLADLNVGTEFELQVAPDGGWRLRPLRSAPLLLSATEHVRVRQLHAIRRMLGEPHMWKERDSKDGYPPKCMELPIPGREELEHCVKHLRAHRDAPTRYHRRFWDQLMAGSLPDLQPPICKKR